MRRVTVNQSKVAIFASAALLAIAAPATAITIPTNSWVKQPTPSHATLPGFPGTFEARGWNHMLYDSVGQRMVLYDGYLDATRPYSIYANALWTYDLNANRLSLESVSNWVRQNGATVPLPANTTTPTPYDRHSYSGIAIVPYKNRLYMWGGANNSIPTNYLGDTWCYDFGTRLWREIPWVDPHPYTAFEQGMVWDSAARKLVLYAGAPSGYKDGDRAFTFDPATEQWSDRSAVTQPSVRMSESMVYDPVRRVSWVFGGGTYGVAGNELWKFDATNGAWQQVTPSGAIPPARRFGALAYDSRNDVILLWGGIVDDVTQLNDTWIFKPAIQQWQQLVPAASPPSSGWNSEDLAYDPVNNAFILHQNGEFWLYRYATSGDVTPPATIRDAVTR